MLQPDVTQEGIVSTLTEVELAISSEQIIIIISNRSFINRRIYELNSSLT